MSVSRCKVLHNVWSLVVWSTSMLSNWNIGWPIKPSIVTKRKLRISAPFLLCLTCPSWLGIWIKPPEQSCQVEWDWMLEIPLLNPGGLELDACPHTCRMRCCEILLRPFAEQTNFITVGTKTYSPRGVRTFDHALYNLPSVGVFPYKFGRRLIYAIFATW